MARCYLNSARWLDFVKKERTAEKEKFKLGVLIKTALYLTYQSMAEEA